MKNVSSVSTGTQSTNGTNWMVQRGSGLCHESKTWVILALSQDCELDLEREGARPRFKDVRTLFFKLGLAMKAKVQH